MRKTYRLVLEVGLEQCDEQKAIQIARGHYRKAGPGRTPVDWNRMGGKWRRITAEECAVLNPAAEDELIEHNPAQGLGQFGKSEMATREATSLKPN